MESKLSEHFYKARLNKGLTLGQVTRLVGYRNVSKGANRINAFERGGSIHRDLRTKLADVLGIDHLTVERLMDEDRRQFFATWNAWANEPIRPYLIIRLMPAVYCAQDLPAEIESAEAAEEYAVNVARSRHLRCCLVLSRRISVWIEANGSISGVSEAVPGEPNTPVMWVGGNGRNACLMKTLDHGMALQQIHWPQQGKS
jgi:hypothetical protein